MNDFFIFTEAYKCGLIAKKSLESFHQHHDLKVNIIGTPNDFNYITPHPNNAFIDISEHYDIINAYNYGHRGTATIFSKVIDNSITNLDKVIHFDSDTIFMKECIDLIIQKLNNNYDLVGPYRCYKNNLNGRKDLNNLPDVVQTYIMGFNKKKIKPQNNLVEMCQGSYEPMGWPVLDFFDPISFTIIRNNGKIFFLDYNDYGGMNHDGDKNNFYAEINQKIDFGDKIIHFAGVGSGMNFYNNPNNSTYGPYMDWAKSQYVIYQKLFYDENFPGNCDYEKLLLLKKFITK